MPPAFTDETALAWFGPDRTLYQRLWALSAEQVSAVARMADEPIPEDGVDYWVGFRTSWAVEAFHRADDQWALTFHLPPSFGFAQAARWAHLWSIDVYCGEFPLEGPELAELGALLGVSVDPARYAYFFGARSADIEPADGGAA
ncbi:hypothetical protein KDL01_39525 [Actinospica durhamensis]|uniref:Uncharacterized protein n=2 Tax=Actinospica durhamensis TaxID=1508375 RepID=A0A941EWF1_9ACTN|nr:hypothetical protein [Actinospica durhamensis]